MHSLGYREMNDDDISKILSEIDLNEDQTIEFSEYLTMMKNFKSGKQTQFTKLTTKTGAAVYRTGGDSSSYSTFSEEEKSAYTKVINAVLATDDDCKKFLPINPDNMDLFASLVNGVILCKLINCAHPGTIDERVVNKKENMNVFLIAVTSFKFRKI
jgi:hypothetical protein